MSIGNGIMCTCLPCAQDTRREMHSLAETTTKTDNKSVKKVNTTLVTPMFPSTLLVRDSVSRSTPLQLSTSLLCTDLSRNPEVVHM